MKNLLSSRTARLTILTLVFVSAMTIGLLSRASAIDIAVETVGSMSANNQAAWWSPIVERNGTVYMSYLAPSSPSDNVFIASRSPSGTYTIRDTGVNSRYDVGHTQTSLSIDGSGYLRVLYGMHGDPISMIRSNQPNSISNGFSSSAPSVFSGGSYTYPNLTTTPNGDVYMIVRDRRSSYISSGVQGRLFRMNNGTQSWTELPPFAGQQNTAVYPDQIYADSAGDLHIIWEWASGGAQSSRHYGTYARFDPDTNTYYRANGTAYPSGPINVANGDVFQGLEGNEAFESGLSGVQSAKMTFDGAGKPIITYSYSLDGTDESYEHRVARWTGNEWIRTTVTSGPFDSDKSWITYSGGLLRFYGTLTPGDLRLGGTDDIFLKTSTDFGATWSAPIAVTSGLDIQRPVGVTVGSKDYLYLPSTSGQTLYLGIVTVPEPSVLILVVLLSAMLILMAMHTKRKQQSV